MLKNITIFTLDGQWDAPSLSELESILERNKFVPCGKTQKRSVGFSAPRDYEGAALIEASGSHWLLRLTIQTKSVPPAALREELTKRCEKIELDTGVKPKGKYRKEIKEELELEMLPRAFAKSNSTLIWIDRDNGKLIVGSTSNKVVETAVSAIIELMAAADHPIGLTPFSSGKTPLTTLMSDWLASGEAPEGFTLDRNLELRLPGHKTSVRYSDHNLEGVEIREHLKQGKVPTLLALTFEDRVSFNFTQAGDIRQISFIDVEEERPESESDKDELFDAQAALVLGEVSALIDALDRVIN